VATLKKYNIEGKEVGKVDVDESLAQFDVNSQMVKDYLVALRNNARQWSACTKTRSEVKHTTKKSVRQKGTGGARHGNLVAPQFRGGGIVFGPKPKFDQHVKINQKEKKAAIRYLISQCIAEGRVSVLDKTELKEPKTKVVANFLRKTGLKGKVLFLAEGNTEVISVEGRDQPVSVAAVQHRNFAKSLKNIPHANFALAKNISGYDVLCAKELVLTEKALDEVKEWLCA
jgi:large subunit ribosomal protein L4